MLPATREQFALISVRASQATLRRWDETVAVRILVVDDDRAVRESLRRSLSFNGYSVELAQDGVEALDMIASDRPDALVLDVMMPRLDGLEVCRQLRSTGDDLPILVLTARDSVSERVAGLDAGADDYLPKPFALEELLARMRALLRRTSLDDAAESVAMTFSDLSLDPVTREVTRGQRQISLTRTEFALLEMLIANPRRVLTRSRILEEVWGFDFPDLGQCAGGVRRIPAPQDRGRGRAAADPHRARGGLRAARDTALMPGLIPPAKPSSAASQHLAVAALAGDAAGDVDGGDGRRADGRRGLRGGLRGALRRHRQPAAQPGPAADRKRFAGRRPGKAIEGTAYSDVNAMLVNPGRSIYTANQEGQTLPVGEPEKDVIHGELLMSLRTAADQRVLAVHLPNGSSLLISKSLAPTERC